MATNEHELNPYASPTPEKQESGKVGSSSSLSEQLDDARNSIARWTAILSLSASAILILGAMVVKISDTGASSTWTAIYRFIGVALFLTALAMYLIGPILWYRHGRKMEQ